MVSNLQQRDAKVCWHPFTQHQIDPLPLPIVSAKDTTLVLEDGSTRIDAISSWWSVLHGHCRPELAEVLFKQASLWITFYLLGARINPLLSWRNY